MKNKNWDTGIYEHKKFSRLRMPYKKLIKNFERNFNTNELIEYFPIFAGELTLSRYLTIYEYYKKTQNLTGHIGEVGSYKGASLIFLGKLVSMFEKNSLTMVHGFDWFKGNIPDKNNDAKYLKKFSEKHNYQKLLNVIKDQNLDNLIKVHKLDVTKELKKFFSKKENSHIFFKFVFLDSGTYKVTKSAIKVMWDRLVPGGIMVFDQLYFELAPGETRAKNQTLAKFKVKKIPNSWMPNGYILKK